MSDWADGYITKVAYHHNYYRYLLPRLLSFAALSQGVAAPGGGAEKLRVLELGCGQGVSANIIAAANPELDYTAIDFNPAHIANAQALASAAGTPNLHFLESNFEDIANDPTWGTFDVITLHGIYSWVSAANREHIIRIAREKLRPGGLLYLSYNTHPGTTPLIPIRKIFIDVAADTPNAPIFDQLDRALGLFEQLAKLKSRYLQAVPGLAQRIEQLRSQDRNYVAHEYLNRDWTIFHFDEVAAEMARAKLTYVASAHLLDHLDGLNLSEEQRDFLATMRDPIRRESLRDLLVDQHFRRDIFAKGTVPLGDSGKQRGWENLRFALSTELSEVLDKEKKSWDTSHRGVMKEIVKKLSAEPMTGQQLSKDLQISVVAAGFRRIMIYLVGKEYCHIAPPEKNESERVKRTDALNTAILYGDHHCKFLASPVLGEAVPIDELTQLFLVAAREKIADPIAFIWERLKSAGQTIVKDGKALEGEEAIVAELRHRIADFHNGRSRLLAGLKVY